MISWRSCVPANVPSFGTMTTASYRRASTPTQNTPHFNQTSQSRTTSTTPIRSSNTTRRRARYAALHYLSSDQLVSSQSADEDKKSRQVSGVDDAHLAALSDLSDLDYLRSKS